MTNRARAVRVLDVIGLALLAYLIERTLWNPSLSTVDIPLAAVGAVGLLAALLSESPRPVLDWPQALYVGLAILSYVIGRMTHYVETPFVPYDWQPPIHLVLLTVYLMAASWLLRTPRRLAVAAAIVVATSSLFGVMATADHLAHGLNNRIYLFPSMGEWGGYAQASLLLGLGVPFALAGVMLAGSGAMVAVSAAIILTIPVMVLLAYSRAADFAMALACCAIASLEPLKLKRSRVVLTLPILGLAAAAFLIKTRFLASLLELPELLFRSSERVQIWAQASALIRLHPWLGVGLGNYLVAMRALSPVTTVPYFAHPHNMILHIAAESGIPAAIAFVWMYARFLMLSVSGPVKANLIGLVRIGCFGALTTIFVKGMIDSAFLSGLVISERMSVVVWTVFAMTIAAATAATQAASGEDAAA